MPILVSVYCVLISDLCPLCPYISLFPHVCQPYSYTRAYTHTCPLCICISPFWTYTCTISIHHKQYFIVACVNTVIFMSFYYVHIKDYSALLCPCFSPLYTYLSTLSISQTIIPIYISTYDHILDHFTPTC